MVMPPNKRSNGCIECRFHYFAELIKFLNPHLAALATPINCCLRLVLMETAPCKIANLIIVAQPVKKITYGR